jgi:hypothetical protein
MIDKSTKRGKKRKEKAKAAPRQPGKKPATNKFIDSFQKAIAKEGT